MKFRKLALLMQFLVLAIFIQAQTRLVEKIEKKGNEIVIPYALAKKMLKPDQMFVLLVGDKAKILGGIKKTGYQIIEMDVDGNIFK